jgi:hypothetical protein
MPAEDSSVRAVFPAADRSREKPVGNPGGRLGARWPRRKLVFCRKTRDLAEGALCGGVVLSLALSLAGCGDFWQAPNSTGSSTSSGTTQTTTTLVPSSSTATEGSSVTLTATVSPSAATGTVTFYDNSTSVGTQTLADGTAALSVTFSATGAQSLTATYGGSSTYASSTSSAVTVTVGASSATAARTALASAASSSVPVAPKGSSVAVSTAPASGDIRTTAYEAAPVEATNAFSATGRTFSANDAEAVRVERAGSVALTDTTLSGAAGNGRGVFLYRSSSDGPGALSFSMTGGSMTYTCDPVSTPVCASEAPSRGQNTVATVFSVDDAAASIALTDVKVSNNTGTAVNRNGTLLMAGALPDIGAPIPKGGQVNFSAQGTALTGDVIVDGFSTAAIWIVADGSGTGSLLTGAINRSGTAKAVTLTLDPASAWIVTATSYLTSLAGLDLSGSNVRNIDGGGHCVYYTGSVEGSGAADGSNRSAVYELSGGGYLAPKGMAGLACE